VKRLFRLVNIVVASLSETPLHRLFSHQVLVLRFIGRRSGKGYAIPVSYLVAEDTTLTLHCMTDIAGVWWKNLIQAGVIEVSWKGQRLPVAVEVVRADPDAIQNALGAFCRASAISAFFAGVKMVDGAPDSKTLAAAAAEHVLIRLKPSL
jgi:hypothetical protein